MKSILLRLPIFILSFLMINNCSKNPVTGKKELLFMSESQEKAMGKNADPSIVASMGLYADDAMQKFITEKGKEMAAISHRPKLDYQFKVLDSPVVNAFAVPGGYVYFTRGIMAHFNNEAEFAGVLGHEIGHVAAKHSARQQTSQILGQVGLLAGAIASKEFAQFAEQAAQGLQLLFLKNSRAHESESDKLGVEYASQVGYDAQKMAAFFGTLKKLSAKAGQTIPTFMSTHPDPGQREKKVGLMARAWQQKNPGDYKVNRDSYLRMIDGIVYGEDPKQGFVENDMFYHPEMKFQFPVPSGWQYQNSPIQFQMAPKDGKAMMVLTLGNGKTLEEAASNAVQQLKLQVIARENTKIGGFAALELISDINSQQAADPSKSVRVASTFIQFNDLILLFHGMSYVPDFDRNHRIFERTTKTFRKLTDPDKLNRKPDRVRIKTNNRNQTLQQALQAHRMPADKMKDLAILNGMELSDRLKSGQLFKILTK